MTREWRGNSFTSGLINSFSSFLVFLSPVDRLQPNVDTRQKQLAAWCSLALAYCRHHKLYTLDVMESQESPVFNNKKIERILADALQRRLIRTIPGFFSPWIGPLSAWIIGLHCSQWAWMQQINLSILGCFKGMKLLFKLILFEWRLYFGEDLLID